MNKTNASLKSRQFRDDFPRLGAYRLCLVPLPSTTMPSQPVSDDEEEMKSPEGVNRSDNEQPEVENSTYYSSRRRRKSTRGLMGMGIREYLVKGVCDQPCFGLVKLM